MEIEKKYPLKYTQEEIKKIIEVDNKHLNLTVISTEYTGYDSIKVQCNICEHKFNPQLCSLQAGGSCRKCYFKRNADSQRFTLDKVKKILEKFEFELLDDEYKNLFTPIKVKCKEGHVFKKQLADIYHKNQGCPQCCCILGISEEMCRKYLEYLFDTQFTRCSPLWLINTVGNKLIFDGYSKDLQIAFEYMGVQHYKFIKHFHKTFENYLDRLSFDTDKAKRCAEQNIKLIVIPYTIKDEDLFFFIKQECKRLDIDFIDKPDLECDKLNILNDYVKEKNKTVDDRLENSNFKRISNYVKCHGNIKLQCKKCNTVKSSQYANIMNKTNTYTQCINCFKLARENKSTNTI